MTCRVGAIAGHPDDTRSGWKRTERKASAMPQGIFKIVYWPFQVNLCNLR